MAYSSNINEVLEGLQNDLKKIENTEPVIREIAVSLASSNTRRIHNEGQRVSGSQIGNYKPSTKRIRNKAGRQTSFVDLSFTGQLSKDLVAESVPGGWVVGFINPSGRTPSSGKIREFQEKRFNGEIYGITISDQDAISRIISKRIKFG